MHKNYILNMLTHDYSPFAVKIQSDRLMVDVELRPAEPLFFVRGGAT
jgi:hypothetical protein